jgi:aspartate carbamoyltransferase
MTHLLSASEITKFQLISYIRLAEKMCVKERKPTTISRNGSPLLDYYGAASYLRFPNKTLITMFYEPSTRTNCSFQAAAIKLGCKVIALTDQDSSSKKGESLEDTIRTLQYYGDAIVLRHPEKGSAQRAAAVSHRVPIINGGDGNGEHPTQALLDIFTIYSELFQRGIDLFAGDDRAPITVTFVGDLKNSRTVHSLIRLLVHFSNIRFAFVSPESLEMPEEISRNIVGQKMPSIQEAIYNTDVLYMTRIQKERFATEDEYTAIMSNMELYCLTPEIMRSAKETMILMHPLPRLQEIPPEIDDDPRAVYFKQVENGVYMRMAILHTMWKQ